MKRRLARTMLAVALLGVFPFLTGCQSVRVNTTSFIGDPTYPPAAPSAVTILRQAPTQPTIRLGQIVLEPWGSPPVSELEQKFQQSAAKLGADAVVIVSDRTQIMGANVIGPWWDQTVDPVYGRVIVGVAVRYIH